ncbi:MAG: hypothetical protein AB2L11_03245 [Syntrophobacteraceae bacterium]
MILNNYIITYLLCALISTLIGVIAACTGIGVWKRWDAGSALEEQYRLEKKVYLIITILSLGFLIRLLSAPLWFWTLESMIISIPGAMCLVGVHNIALPVSYMASGMKLIQPVFYGYWLILNFLDRKVIEQPFMKQKLLLLAPLGFLVLMETGLDAAFLFSVPPRQVSCCTSLFDLPGESAPAVVTTASEPHWLPLFYWAAVLILADIFLLMPVHGKRIAAAVRLRKRNKTTASIRTLLAFFALAACIAAIHGTISPLLLKLPFHHCVFCLCQQRLDALVAFCLIFAGLSLFTICAWLIATIGKWAECSDVTDPIDGMVKWAGFLVLGGVTILSTALVMALI